MKQYSFLQEDFSDTIQRVQINSGTNDFDPIHIRSRMDGDISAGVHGNVDTHLRGKVDAADNLYMGAGTALGGVGGYKLSKIILRNVKDIKDAIKKSSNANECIEFLNGYSDGVTPIAFICSKCIKYCQKYPNNYKGKCLKILNNYFGIGTAIGTIGGAALGGATGYQMSQM